MGLTGCVVVVVVEKAPGRRRDRGVQRAGWCRNKRINSILILHAQVQTPPLRVSSQTLRPARVSVSFSRGYCTAYISNLLCLKSISPLQPPTSRTLAGSNEGMIMCALSSPTSTTTTYPHQAKAEKSYVIVLDFFYSPPAADVGTERKSQPVI